MRRMTLFLALFAMMTAFGASKAHAVLLTYSYTGNNFTFAQAPFTTSDRIMGSFTIDCGLLGGGGDCSSLAGTLIPTIRVREAITSFSFTADGFTIDSASQNADLGLAFLSTDADSNIVFWDLEFILTAPSLEAIVTSGDPYRSSDFVFLGIYEPQGIRARNFDDPGRWNAPEVAVGEPSALASVAVSLAALLLFLWRLRGWPVRACGRPLAP